MSETQAAQRFPDADIVYASENGEWLAASEIVLYRRTHFNEDGIAQYEVAGVTRWAEEAEAWLAGGQCAMIRVIQDRSVRQ